MSPLEDMSLGMKRDTNSNPIRSPKESTVDKSIILTIKGLAAKFGTFWLLICVYAVDKFYAIKRSQTITRLVPGYSQGTVTFHTPYSHPSHSTNSLISIRKIQ